MNDFGFLLRLAREKRGLTQLQVMRQTGINNKTLSGYENGISEPDLQTLTVLFRLYDVSADKMLGLEPLDRAGAETPLECELLQLFRRLPEDERELCVLLLKTLLQHRKK